MSRVIIMGVKPSVYYWIDSDVVDDIESNDGGNFNYKLKVNFSDNGVSISKYFKYEAYEEVQDIVVWYNGRYVGAEVNRDIGVGVLSGALIDRDAGYGVGIIDSEEVEL